ncbi:MAG: hypothetical protein JJU03_11615 [Idiomarina sp.]|nr:hypothetical protein [Idiomarina sp.]
MLKKRLEQRFWLARAWFSLSFVYAAGFIFATLFVFMTAGPETANYQHAFLLNSGLLVLLWVGLIIARPKPVRARPRAVFALLEYSLVGLFFSLALVLFSHYGWYISASAPAGFAAIAWGIGWIAAWLGPAVIGVLALLSGHWVWLSVFMDYRSACWRFVEQEHTEALLSELEQHLQADNFLREKDAQYVGRKLIHWQLTRAWKPFELDLPSSAARLVGHMLPGKANTPRMLSIDKRSVRLQDEVLQTIIVPWPEQKT